MRDLYQTNQRTKKKKAIKEGERKKKERKKEEEFSNIQYTQDISIKNRILETY
jgi:hypothetical protein